MSTKNNGQSGSDLTYTERAGKMALKARTAAALAGEKLYRRAEATLQNANIKSINLLREAGEKFNDASGRNQLFFNLEGLEFCRKSLIPLLKTGMTVKEIQMCCHIAARVKKPIETVAELHAIKAELQMSLRVIGLMDQPHHEGQSLIERNLFCTITTAARKFELLLEDLEKERPMDKWDADALEEFLESAQPVKKRIEQAEKMLGGKTR